MPVGNWETRIPRLTPRMGGTGSRTKSMKKRFAIACLDVLFEAVLTLALIIGIITLKIYRAVTSDSDTSSVVTPDPPVVTTTSPPVTYIIIKARKKAYWYQPAVIGLTVAIPLVAFGLYMFKLGVKKREKERELYMGLKEEQEESDSEENSSVDDLSYSVTSS